MGARSAAADGGFAGGSAGGYLRASRDRPVPPSDLTGERDRGGSGDYAAFPPSSSGPAYHSFPPHGGGSGLRSFVSDGAHGAGSAALVDDDDDDDVGDAPVIYGPRPGAGRSPFGDGAAELDGGASSGSGTSMFGAVGARAGQRVGGGRSPTGSGLFGGSGIGATDASHDDAGGELPTELPTPLGGGVLDQGALALAALGLVDGGESPFAPERAPSPLPSQPSLRRAGLYTSARAFVPGADGAGGHTRRGGGERARDSDEPAVQADARSRTIGAPYVVPQPVAPTVAPHFSGSQAPPQFSQMLYYRRTRGGGEPSGAGGSSDVASAAADGAAAASPLAPQVARGPSMRAVPRLAAPLPLPLPHGEVGAPFGRAQLHTVGGADIGIEATWPALDADEGGGVPHAAPVWPPLPIGPQQPADADVDADADAAAVAQRLAAQRRRLEQQAALLRQHQELLEQQRHEVEFQQWQQQQQWQRQQWQQEMLARQQHAAPPYYDAQVPYPVDPRWGGPPGGGVVLIGGGGGGGGGGGAAVVPGQWGLHPDDWFKDMSGLRCRSCGAVGHVMRYCARVVCFTCGSPGHMASVCRMGGGGGAGDGGAGAGGHGTGVAWAPPNA